jgi:hypothetical protein
MRGERLRELHEGDGLYIDCVQLSTTAANQVHRIKHQSAKILSKNGKNLRLPRRRICLRG